MKAQNDLRGRGRDATPPNPDRSRVTFETALGRYLEDKPRSRATIQIVTQLAPYWGRLRLDEIQQTHMAGYANSLRHLAQSTQARMCRQARTVYYYGCELEGLPYKRLRVPREGDHCVEFLSRDQLTQLLANMEPSARALAMFMAYTGARFCEARIVERADIRTMDDQSMVRLRHRKGRDGVWRERWVPLHPELQALLRKVGYTEGPMLRTEQGERWSANGKGLRDHMHKVARSLGFDARPHVLRHTFGTLLAKEGGDIRLLAELLGHAALDQTRKYINASNTMAAALIGKL